MDVTRRSPQPGHAGSEPLSSAPELFAPTRSRGLTPEGNGHPRFQKLFVPTKRTETAVERRSAPAGRLYSGTTRRAPDCGQLLYAQTSQGAYLAGTEAPLSCPLHANQLFMAESGGALVWPDHPAGHSPRLLQQRQGFDRKNRRLCLALQSLASILRLDRYC